MSKPSITNDEVIRAGAEILLKGGIMLSKACPDCFSPLYKIQGKTLCVKCKKHFILVVCGSASSWLTKNIVNDKGGLHNRLTDLINLKTIV